MTNSKAVSARTTFLGRASNAAILTRGTIEERAAAGMARAASLCRDGERGLNLAALEIARSRWSELTQQVAAAVRTHELTARAAARR